MDSTSYSWALRPGANCNSMLSMESPVHSYTGGMEQEVGCNESWSSWAAGHDEGHLSSAGFGSSLEQDMNKRPVESLSYPSSEEKSYYPGSKEMDVSSNKPAATAAICPSTISRGIVKSRKFPGRADKQAREKRTKKTGIRCEHCYRGKKVCHKEGSYGHHDGLSFCQKWQLVRDRCSTCRIENRVCSGEYPCGHCVLRSHCVYSDYLKYNWGRTKT